MLEDSTLLMEDDMKVPATTEGSNRGFDTMGFATNNFDFDRAVFARRPSTWDSEKLSVLWTFFFYIKLTRWVQVPGNSAQPSCISWGGQSRVEDL